MKRPLTRAGRASRLLSSPWGRTLLCFIAVMTTTAARAEPAVRLSAARLFYGNQLVGWRSPARTLTITNSGTSPLTIHSLSFSGADPLDFPIARDAAGATLAPGASLDVGLQFRPMAAGDRSAVLVISDNAPGSPRVVALAGSGVGTYVNRSPRSVDFGGCVIGKAV